MVPWWWSVLLTAVGVTSLYIAGSKKSWGWGINLGAQGLWLVYAVATEQWGFIPACAVYGWVYWRNLRAWRVNR